MFWINSSLNVGKTNKITYILYCRYVFVNLQLFSLSDDHFDMPGRNSPSLHVESLSRRHRASSDISLVDIRSYRYQRLTGDYPVLQVEYISCRHYYTRENRVTERFNSWFLRDHQVVRPMDLYNKIDSDIQFAALLGSGWTSLLIYSLWLYLNVNVHHWPKTWPIVCGMYFICMSSYLAVYPVDSCQIVQPRA